MSTALLQVPREHNPRRKNPTPLQIAGAAAITLGLGYLVFFVLPGAAGNRKDKADYKSCSREWLDADGSLQPGLEQAAREWMQANKSQYTSASLMATDAIRHLVKSTDRCSPRGSALYSTLGYPIRLQLEEIAREFGAG